MTCLPIHMMSSSLETVSHFIFYCTPITTIVNWKINCSEPLAKKNHNRKALKKKGKSWDKDDNYSAKIF